MERVIKLLIRSIFKCFGIWFRILIATISLKFAKKNICLNKTRNQNVLKCEDWPQKSLNVNRMHTGHVMKMLNVNNNSKNSKTGVVSFVSLGEARLTEIDTVTVTGVSIENILRNLKIANSKLLNTKHTYLIIIFVT